MHLAHVAGSQTRGHRFDALALNRQHKCLGVVLHRDPTVGMSCGLSEAIQISLEPTRLTGEFLLAKAHSTNVLFSNLLR